MITSMSWMTNNKNNLPRQGSDNAAFLFYCFSIVMADRQDFYFLHNLFCRNYLNFFIRKELYYVRYFAMAVPAKAR